MIALRRREKLTLEHMYVIASEYDSSFFSAILLASCFIVRVADCLPYRTRAERSYSSRRQVIVAHQYGSTEIFGHDLASGLKIFPSKK